MIYSPLIRQIFSDAQYVPWQWWLHIDILRPKQNSRRFADDIFKCIFVNENVWISIKIPLRYVAKGLINNIPALVQIMAWRRPGDKPLSEPMMSTSLPTHICVTWSQWVNAQWRIYVSVRLVIIGSGNGLSPDMHQANTWTDDDFRSIEPISTNLFESWVIPSVPAGGRAPNGAATGTLRLQLILLQHLTYLQIALEWVYKQRISKGYK